ncbi:MAG: hypothetical protein R3F55_12950 [Alphaproteobacteria bacterium]
MTMLDRVLAFLAIAGLLAFVGVIGGFVLEVDLIAVFAIGGALAIYDFVNSFRAKPNGNGQPRD